MSDHWDHLCRLAENEVRKTMSSLPRDLRERARKLPVTFETAPSQAWLDDGIAADTLGLFVGGEYAEEDRVPIPPQIILFLENIWDFAEADEDFFREEIRVTLLHELGHYLGLDEDDLVDRGLE